jgi:chromosome segregation ATPase
MEALSKLDVAEEELRNTNAALQSATSEVSTIVTKLRPMLPPEDWDKTQKQTSSAQTLATLGMMKSGLHGLEAEEKSLSESHTESVRQSATTQSQIDLAESEKNTAAEQINVIKSYLNGKGEQPQIKCDKCGTILTEDQWIKHIGEEKKDLQNLQNSLAELNKRLETKKTLVNKYERRPR